MKRALRMIWRRFNGPGLPGVIAILSVYALVEWVEQWGGPTP